MERRDQLLIRTPEGIVFTMTLAGPLSRFLALSIDVGCTMVLSNVVGMLLKGFKLVSADAAVALSILAFFVISFAYSILLEWYARGQTLGKRLLRLRVVDAQGLRLQFSQIAIRNLLRAVDGLPAMYMVGGLACFLSPLAQRLGDIAANTIVVRTPKIRQPDLDQVATPKYNSFRSYPHLVARLRQRVTAQEAGVALQSVLRRDEFDPAARVELFGEMAAHFRSLVPFPEDFAEGLTDEQYVRNLVDLLFVKQTTGTRGSA
jgi:uncharacterized RDD family membrane protein YckC